MSINMESLINGSLALASLPEVVMRAVDLINDPNSSAAQIGAIIAEDPGLTARLLKIVNSPFYGFPSRIDTVSRAITVIGTVELLDLILATSVVKTFRGIPTELVDMNAFWEHCLFTAVLARTLAMRQRAVNTERYFIAGLLHDIGALVLYKQAPEIARQALQQARDQQQALHEAEQTLLGFHHGDVGANLLEAWHLPQTLIEVARFHHTPDEAKRLSLETYTVHLADLISCTRQDPCHEAQHENASQLAAAWTLVGLPPRIVDSVLKEAEAQFEDARVIITPQADVA